MPCLRLLVCVRCVMFLTVSRRSSRGKSVIRGRRVRVRCFSFGLLEKEEEEEAGIPGKDCQKTQKEEEEEEEGDS